MVNLEITQPSAKFYTVQNALHLSHFPFDAVISNNGKGDGMEEFDVNAKFAGNRTDFQDGETGNYQFRFRFIQSLSTDIRQEINGKY